MVNQSFEQLNQRAVAVVIDPIQSVKGKVIIDAFRLINPQLMILNQEPRQTTSNVGHLNKPSIQVSSTVAINHSITTNSGDEETTVIDGLSLLLILSQVHRIRRGSGSVDSRGRIPID